MKKVYLNNREKLSDEVNARSSVVGSLEESVFPNGESQSRLVWQARGSLPQLIPLQSPIQLFACDDGRWRTLSGENR